MSVKNEISADEGVRISPNIMNVNYKTTYHPGVNTVFQKCKLIDIKNNYFFTGLDNTVSNSSFAIATSNPGGSYAKVNDAKMIEKFLISKNDFNSLSSKNDQ